MLRPYSLSLLAALSLSCGNDVGSGKGAGAADVAASDGHIAIAPDVSLDAASSGYDGKDSGSPGAGADDFETPCSENLDCSSGFCIESYDGFVCTQTCLEDCPEGYSCKSVLNTYPDVAFICVASILKLCQPCKNDLQCGGGRCLAIGPAGSFCTSECDEAQPCADGYTCTATGGTSVCLPNSGSCDCTSSTVGAVRTCNKSDETGTCYGYQTCEGAAGWGGCTAPAPAKEVCDGVDNDCDGKLDEEVGAGEPCNVANDLGSCTGILSCLGPLGAVCSADPPAPEACNLKDDDCNGKTDETFLDANGKYFTNEHCGKCGVNCLTAIAFATGTCDALTLDPPACVVKSCIAGYYPVNPFTCAPVPTSLCQPCLEDGGCAVEGAKCVSLADGSYCSLPCPDGQCPNGYMCQTLQDGSDQCIPETGSCSCDGSNPSLQKSCEQVWQDPLDPTAPIVTCAGVRHCTEAGWGSCLMGVDACDGVDNDCDGVIDGPWVDASGKYVADTNCGVCGNSCLAQPPANAVGACDGSGAVPSCAMKCMAGFWDVDQNPNNGCECDFASDFDFPDGPDQNCDGVDGEVLNAIFVAKTGHDVAAGTIDDPMLTIQAGVDRAAATGKRDVYVATGVYSESIALKSGVGTYGGYSGDFHARNTTLYETAILGKPASAALPAAVNASGLTGGAGTTVLDGFTIFGEDNKTPGGSSVAVRLVDCGDAVVVRNNRAFAGDGGNGTLGKPGATGGSGSAGKAGKAAYDIGKPTCSVKDENPGGGGGKNTCGGASVSGGDGGAAICPDFDANTAECLSTNESIDQTVTPAENGKGGAGPAPGAGGEAGHDSLISKRHGPHNGYACADNNNNCSSCNLPPGESKDGTPGTDGESGTPGDAGGGCDDAGGAMQGGLWSPGAGNGGAAGQDGSGGGGGGAAGGVEAQLCSDQGSGYSDIGGSGGGGGSGGCGGTAGTAGTGGGGSFGVLIVFTAPPATLPALADNAIVRGNGGAGGHGGQGGTGGGGGAAGNGGPSTQEAFETFCTAPGGKGGQGGAGGHGGGGGGGCGGVSYGVYVHGAAGDPAWSAGNVYGASGVPGPGGLGGQSLGNPGKSGKPGWEGDTNL